MSGFFRRRNGYVDALQYDDFKLENENIWGARGALKFAPTDRITSVLTIDYSQCRDAPAPVVAIKLGNVSIGGDAAG